MGLSIACVKAALELHKQGTFGTLENVFDLGSQEIQTSYEDFIYLCAQTGLQPQAAEFEKLKNFPGFPRCSTKYFWSLLGAKSAVCSDVNEQHDSFYIDLNAPLSRPDLEGKFDLVTDFGNNEHIFNVGEAFRTMHRLCKPNGLLWIDQAVIKGNGFFNFDQSFFEGLAAANNYTVLYSAYLIRLANDPMASQFHVPCDKALLDTFDLSKIESVGITAIFRKTSADDFRYHYQGNFNRPRERFLVQFLANRFPPERYYIPVFPEDIVSSLGKRDLLALIPRIAGTMAKRATAKLTKRRPRESRRSLR